MQDDEASTERESWFHAIFDNVSDAIFIHELGSGRIIDVNARMCELYECTREEALRAGISQFSSGVPPFTPECAEEHIRRALDGEPQTFEWHARTLKGRLFWVEVGMRRATIRNETRILVTARDITERQRVEEDSRTSRAMLQLVLDAIPVCVHWKDRNSVYQGCNRRFAADAELSDPSQIIGKTDFDLPWKEFAAMYQGRDRAVLSSGQPMLNYEQPRTTSDGRLLCLLQSKLPLRDIRGDIIGVLSIYEDITEQKQSREALLASEHKYRELVQNANSIILRWNRGGEITFLNEFGQRFFGYQEEEILGKHVIGTIVPISESNGRDLRGLMDEITANPGAFEHNTNQNIRRDGSPVWVSWTNRAVFDEQGRLVEVFSVGTDITEQRRAEEALQRVHEELERRVEERTAALQSANERLLELDRLKSEFLAIMSHELRTPLNSIIGFTGIMHQGLAGPINAEQTKQLGMVYGSAKHLLSLINDLLDLSRIDAGKVDFDRSKFNFIDVATEVLEGLRPQASQKGIQLSLVSEVPVLEVIGDRKRCFQILLNLANNAVKFTERGQVEIHVGIDHTDLVVSVVDTGIGIRPEHIGMLFEAFRQVDGSAKRVYEGTGLGLHLCRQLLQLMGGRVDVESEYGKGSRFTFSIPLCLPAELQS